MMCSQDIIQTISEKLKENEINLSFYYYKFYVLGSHDAFNNEEIVIKDPVSLKDRTK